jgi:Cdc6-like AAA superfamily ATPase
MNDNHFPEELLDRSDRERVDYFKTYTLGHPHLKVSLEQLKYLIENPLDVLLALAVGPTGVGKTTLLKKLVQIVVKNRLSELQEDPGVLPIVHVKASVPEGGTLNWKDFFKRLLRGLHEPLVDSTVNSELWRLQDGAYGSRFYSGETFNDLRERVENAIRQRRPAAIIIDEAQHLTKAASGRKLQDQLDLLKALADSSNTLLVLLGTYELLRFRNLSGQLTRRSDDVHLARYRYDSTDQFKIFKNVIRSFEAHLPLKTESNLTEHADFLYERSIGCVGVLKTLLLRSLDDVVRDDQEKVTFKHLKRRARSVSQCQQMIAEAIEGEAQLAEDDAARARLQMLLGIIPPTNPTPATPATTGHSKRRRVGQPSPRRFPVGVE